MVFLVRVVLCLVVCLPALAAPSIPLSEYKQRRTALRAALGESVAILFGRTERETGEIRTGFFQEPNFHYLTGWSEPGAILVLTPRTEVLLLPRRDKTTEHWTGPKAAPGDPKITSLTGFDKVEPVETFEQNLPVWLAEGRHVYTLTESPQAASLGALLPARELRSAALPIAKLRMKKSNAEIEMIQHSTDVAIDAHRAAWKRIRPGLVEHQVAATMSNVYFDRGCERHAYAPIVGSGSNAAVLHYSKNSRRMDSGEVVLMDVGPECAMYATDITRTVPVNGKFTARQREIYELVLGAQKAAIAAVKPGVMLGGRSADVGLHKLVKEYFDKKGVGKYFTHGIGHHVGLDVHDANDAAMPLEAGMVITIEPGLYLAEEGIGVRIEDMILVTENGAKLLSDKLPREAAAIEREMGAR